MLEVNYTFYYHRKRQFKELDKKTTNRGGILYFLCNFD
jgi:hypothetical protein